MLIKKDSQEEEELMNTRVTRRLSAWVCAKTFTKDNINTVPLQLH